MKKLTRLTAAALAVMLTGDAAAALVGRRFGRIRLVNGKSLEGCASFVVAGYAALAAVLAISGHGGTREDLAGIAAVLLAALAELFQKQLKLDDNLTIPLVAGSAMLLFLRLL